jgi:hypothetical protein
MMAGSGDWLVRSYRPVKRAKSIVHVCLGFEKLWEVFEKSNPPVIINYFGHFILFSKFDVFSFLHFFLTLQKRYAKKQKVCKVCKGLQKHVKKVCNATNACVTQIGIYAKF